MEWLPWQDAAGAAAGAVVATRSLGARFTRSRIGRAAGAWTRELAVMFALYGLWQLAGSLSLGRIGGAVARGRAIARLEGDLGLPGEATVQRLLLDHHAVMRVFNLYYVVLHVAVTGACLVWVFARHRDRYPIVRNALALATGISLLVALVPVAPPRLVPGLGVADAGRLIGPTVYPATARPGLDQLSAMPSVHVAWALVVAGAVIYSLRSQWRWLAAAYPVFTVTVVVVTGNHYWADAAAAAVICAVAALAAQALAGAAGRWRSGALADGPQGAGGVGVLDLHLDLGQAEILGLGHPLGHVGHADQRQEGEQEEDPFPAYGTEQREERHRDHEVGRPVGQGGDAHGRASHLGRIDLGDQ